MAFRSITTISTNSATQSALIHNAALVAEQARAHLDVLCLGLDRTQPGFYYAGTSAIVFQDNLANAHAYCEQLEADAHATLQGGTIDWSITGVTAQAVAVNNLIAQRARYADLVVLPRPYGGTDGNTKHDRENEAIVEAALFNANTPVLILPDDTAYPEQLNNIVIAWNDSAEALRAARAALPLLKAAKNVCIAIIDPPAHSPERSDPGGALAQMLARHGVRAEVSVLARTLPRISDTLNSYVQDKAAQMIVMGAYGHSRFREAIMGGATRHMLEHAQVPVFMAH